MTKQTRAVGHRGTDQSSGPNSANQLWLTLPDHITPQALPQIHFLIREAGSWRVSKSLPQSKLDDYDSRKIKSQKKKFEFIFKSQEFNNRD